MKVMLELEEQAQAQACTEMSRSRIVDDAKEGQRCFAFWPIEFPSSSVALAVGGALCTASKRFLVEGRRFWAKTFFPPLAESGLGCSKRQATRDGLIFRSWRHARAAPI